MHYSIPTPQVPHPAAHEIAERLHAGERIEYDEIEDRLDDLDFHEVIRPIAIDDGDGWVQNGY